MPPTVPVILPKEIVLKKYAKTISTTRKTEKIKEVEEKEEESLKGSSILIPIATSEEKGLILRDKGYAEQINTLSEYLSHPEWLINKWIKDKSYEDAIQLAEWNNVNPILWFRINKRLYSATKYKNN